MEPASADARGSSTQEGTIGMGSSPGRGTRLAKIVLSAALSLALLAALTRFVRLVLDAPKPFPGYTLIAPLLSTRTFLVDMKGRVVRTWDSDYTAGQCAY